MECSHGRQRLIAHVCRARRSGVQPFAIHLQLFVFLGFRIFCAREGHAVVDLLRTLGDVGLARKDHWRVLDQGQRFDCRSTLALPLNANRVNRSIWSTMVIFDA